MLSWCHLTVCLALKQALSLAVPVDLPTPRWACALTRFSLEQAAKYHSLRLIIEDPEALRPGRPYVVGEKPPHTFSLSSSIIHNAL